MGLRITFSAYRARGRGFDYRLQWPYSDRVVLSKKHPRTQIQVHVTETQAVKIIAYSPTTACLTIKPYLRRTRPRLSFYNSYLTSADPTSIFFYNLREPTMCVLFVSIASLFNFIFVKNAWNCTYFLSLRIIVLRAERVHSGYQGKTLLRSHNWGKHVSSQLPVVNHSCGRQGRNVPDSPRTACRYGHQTPDSRAPHIVC